MSRAQLTSTVEQNTGGAVSPYVAGKNKIINGDFGVWQRGTSISLTTGTAAYTSDQWNVVCNFSAGTASASQQTFTPGTAPVAGYEGTYFHRVTTGSTSTYIEVKQNIENVRTYAGQTVVLSFWAKASTAMTSSTLFRQEFGSGGSTLVDTSGASLSITTSWQRFTTSVTLPSISGKTIGTSSMLRVYPISVSGTFTSATVDIWGVQLEAGSVATAFQTATGTLQGELAACQRYYAKSYAQTVAPATNSTIAGIEFTSTASVAATNTYAVVKLPITMRTSPTVTTYSFTSSTTNVVSNCLGTDLTANSCVPTWANDSQFGVYNNSGGTISASGGGLIFHYTATAEL